MVFLAGTSPATVQGPTATGLVWDKKKQESALLFAIATSRCNWFLNIVPSNWCLWQFSVFAIKQFSDPLTVWFRDLHNTTSKNYFSQRLFIHTCNLKSKYKHRYGLVVTTFFPPFARAMGPKRMEASLFKSFHPLCSKGTSSLIITFLGCHNRLLSTRIMSLWWLL